MNSKKKYKNLVTGIQPTGDGNLHIGNYCGFMYDIKKILDKTHNYIEVENEEIYIFIADLHSMTIYTKNLKEKAFYMVKNLYAFFKNYNINIYIQSTIKGLTEGMWLLSMFTTTGDMNRMTQFKDKKDLGKSNMGLYTYPILMASDILMMNSHLVPVGEDQQQHMELTRNIAEKFNKELPNTFILPNSTINKYRIMKLNDISKKMSKSSPDGCIFLNDSPEVIRKKIGKAQTDSDLFPSTLEDLENRKGPYNLALIYSIIEDISLEEAIEKYKNITWREFKEILSNSLIKFCENFQNNFNNINDKEVLEVLNKSQIKVNKIVDDNLHKIYEFFV
jgi:tryptophanyl-tRNA synthetase